MVTPHAPRRRVSTAGVSIGLAPDLRRVGATSSPTSGSGPMRRCTRRRRLGAASASGVTRPRADAPRILAPWTTNSRLPARTASGPVPEPARRPAAADSRSCRRHSRSRWTRARWRRASSRPPAALLDAPLGYVAVLSHGWRAQPRSCDSAGYPPRSLAAWAHVPLDLPVPMTEAIRTGRAILHRSDEERRGAYRVGRPAHGHRRAPRHPPSSRWRSRADDGRARGLVHRGSRHRRGRALVPPGARVRWARRRSNGRASSPPCGSGTTGCDLRSRPPAPAPGRGASPASGSTGRPRCSRCTACRTGRRPSSMPGWPRWTRPTCRGCRAAADACIRDGATHDEEFRVRPRTGASAGSTARDAWCPRATGAPARLIGTTRDITDRKRAEE